MTLRGLLLVMVLTISSTLLGCAQPPPAVYLQQPKTTPAVKPKKTYQDLVVGYAQIGAESEWRTGNTASVKETAEQLGIELKFSDGQQKQENQIKAIRSFIAMRVDVIGVPDSNGFCGHLR